MSEWPRCIVCGGPLPLKPEGDYCDGCWFGTEGEAQYAFRQVYPADHKNFMTDEPVQFGWLDRNTVFEVSRGTGFEHETIYGVTIVVRRNGSWVREEFETRRSKGVFNTRAEVTAYLNELGGANE